MKKISRKVMLNEVLLTKDEFLESFNENMPQGYPHVSLAILEKFKDGHLTLFKANGLWSLDQHRKRMIDWLPQNT